MPEQIESFARRRMAIVVDELAEEFQGVWSRETIERFVTESREALAARQTAGLNFLPQLAGRFASERLHALALAEGRVERTRPEVLFVCVRNAGRSQIAAAMTEHLSGGAISVRSAGSDPGEAIHPAVLAALAEQGIDARREFPKPLTDEFVRASDAVITMGCGDACPIYPGKRYEDWDITDPAGQPVEVVREIVEDIRERVKTLVASLLAPAATTG